MACPSAGCASAWLRKSCATGPTCKAWASCSPRVSQVDIAVHQMHRASTPCGSCANQPAIIYKVVRGEVLAVVPEFGQVRFPVSELGSADEDSGCWWCLPG